MTTQENDTKPGLFDWVMPGASGVLWLVDKAVGWFGSGDASQSSGGDVQFRGGGGNFGDAADAQTAEAKELKADVDQLEQLRTKLDTISQQIVEDNAGSKAKLLKIKDEIEKELEYAKGSDDNPTKAKNLSKFLVEKSDEIMKIMTDAAAGVGTRGDEINALMQNPGLLDPSTMGYGVPPGGTGGGYGGGGGGGTEPPAAQGQVPGGPLDALGLGQGQPNAMDSFGQAAGQAASAIPGALSGLTGGGGGGSIPDIGSMIGSAMGSARDRGSDFDRRDDRDRDDTRDRDHEPKSEDPKPKAEDPTTDGKTPPEGTTPPAGEGQTPPAPPAPPAPTMVTLPDGTPVQARSAPVAAAARAVFGGATVEDAYRAANVSLPPLGAVVKDTISPLAAKVGDVAVFADKYVMFAGDGKVYLDGQVQPTSAISALAGFKGIIEAKPQPGTAPAVAQPGSPL